jgi:tetratricopeptide (TPR) repeat protein
LPNRPPIPAEIERKVFVESGHRCAVCGDSFPLERAHIIPWNKSKEHKLEDLICLCASCHEKADLQKWGEKTLREYKERPWILRNYKNTTPPEISEPEPQQAVKSTKKRAKAKKKKYVNKNSGVVFNNKNSQIGNQIGNVYNVSGQTGAVGPNAHSHDNTFNQTDNSKKSKMEAKIEGDGDVVIGGNAPGAIIVTGDGAQINQPAPVVLSALHEMPPPSRDFVGRKKEIKELLKALEKNGITISGLQGMGGVGKTALALKLAEHLKPNYPDAQFYLDLKGASKQPLTAAEALAHVIRAFHPEAKLPEEESRLRGLYLSLLEEKKVLLLMDNAATAAQIEPLIPPPTCILLVTSRNRFMIDGLVAKNLDTLEPKDAEKLLLQLAPRIGNCAAKIARLCGYLPLALRLAAGALHKLIMLTPEEYVERLSDETEKLGLIEASLSLSYDLLNGDAQKLWRMLAVFPNTFDTAAVTALWGLSVKETQNRLAELISYSLVEWNDTTRHYRLHDLVRVFANTRLSEAEHHFAKQAHATYFKDLLEQANDCHFQGKAEMLHGLALFDKERENIEAGQSWAAALIGEDETATKLSLNYYFAGLYVLGLRLHPRERIRWLEVALQAARLLEDKWNEGAALGNLGNAYYALGEIRKAIEFYEQALLIDQQIGDRGGEGIALGNLGAAYAALGETRKAIEFYEQRIVIAREIGDRRGEGNALGNLGTAYAALGETRKAIEFYEQRIVIAREIGDHRGEGNALGNLGSAYKELGEYRKAIEYHEQNLEIAREIGDRRGEGATLGNLGNAYKELGETGKAIEFYEQDMEIAREIGDRRGEGAVLGNLGLAYAALGETGKAIEFYEQRLEIAREIGDRQGEGNALWNSALAYKELGDHVQAISLAEMALVILEQVESPHASTVHSVLNEWRAEAE